MPCSQGETKPQPTRGRTRAYPEAGEAGEAAAEAAEAAEAAARQAKSQGARARLSESSGGGPPVARVRFPGGRYTMRPMPRAWPWLDCCCCTVSLRPRPPPLAAPPLELLLLAPKPASFALAAVARAWRCLATEAASSSASPVQSPRFVQRRSLSASDTRRTCRQAKG